VLEKLERASGIEPPSLPWQWGARPSRNRFSANGFANNAPRSTNGRDFWRSAPGMRHVL